MSGTFAEYQAVNAVNISTLFHILESPKAYAHALASPRSDSPALAQGRALHCLVLEPAEFERRYVVSPYADLRSDAAKAWPEYFRLAVFHPTQLARSLAVSPYADFRTKEAQAWKAERIASGSEIVKAADLAMITDAASRYTAASLDPDFEVLSLSQVARLRLAAEEVLQHSQVQRLLSGGAAEETWTWTDPETGIECKARTDYVGSMGLIDLKTTRSIQPRRFASRVASLGYLVKMAWYQWGLELATGCTPPPVYLIAVQLDPYVDVACYQLSDLDLMRARETVRGMLRTLAACRKSGRWPGLMEDRIAALDLPEYAVPEVVESWDEPAAETEEEGVEVLA